MRTMTKLTCAFAVGALMIVGCGGGDSSSEEADTEAVTALVAEINRASAEQDGDAYCSVIQPSNFTDAFSSRSECVRETNQILEQFDEQPELVIEDISLDGDTALVTFTGRSGEARFIKEGETWYLSLGQGSGAESGSESSEDGG